MSDYTPTTWVANTTQATAVRMNNIEDQIEAIDKVVDTGGMTYGTIHQSQNATATVITSSGSAEQYTQFTQNGSSNNMTPDASNNQLTIDDSGVYFIMSTITAESVGGGAIKVSFNVYKNATTVQSLHAHRNLAGGGGDVGSIGLSGIAHLTAGDDLKIFVSNETNTNNVILEDVTLSAIKMST